VNEHARLALPDAEDHAEAADQVLSAEDERVALTRRQNGFREDLKSPLTDGGGVFAVVNVVGEDQRRPDVVHVRACDAFVEADEVKDVSGVGVDEITCPAL